MTEIVENSSYSGLEIAVIGMAGRFPGAKTIHEFWENLKQGKESITFFSDCELIENRVEPELLKNPFYVKAKGVLENDDYFDAEFFGYTPAEADMMDPQVRIFHECAWQALEDAGYYPEAYKGLIGLYAGANSSFYWEALKASSKSMMLDPFSAALLMDKDYLTTRVAYRLNLTGPCISVHTACSTSLVAIHLAFYGLLNAECDLAIAGGISVSLPQKSGYLFQEEMILSPDGHCRAFDAAANGTLLGNGAGVVILKRLEDALSEKDHIYAIIKGSAINNDGIRKIGFTAPSIEGQVDVVKAAHNMAEIDPESIGYVETHGTGTNVGDPIEIEALKRAFDTDEKHFCAVGSVKTNIGHLYVAAGVAGFIKTVLSLKHQLILPSLNFEHPNSGIDFENSPFFVNTQLSAWKRKEEQKPLRAAVTSLGIGGTNAHMILEEAPKISGPVGQWVGGSVSQGVNEKRTDGRGGSLCPPLKSREYQLILLSAKTPSALDKITENLSNHLKQNPGINLADAAYTLQVGRKPFRFKKAALCSPAGETENILEKKSPRVQNFFSKEENPSVIFVLTGQGSQYVNMGLDLYRSEPVFRQEADRCLEKAMSLSGLDLREILYPGNSVSKVSGAPLRSPQPVTANRQRAAAYDISRVDIAQPILFAFEYALAKLLITWGIQPRAMIGYSLGEFVAACLSGVFSLEDAVKLVTFRAQLIQEKTPEGAMLNVPLPEDQLETLLNKDISIANVNGPSCIVTGTMEAVAAFEKKMKKKKLWCTRLNVSRSSHSASMNTIREEFENQVKKVGLNAPRIPILSNVTGHWLTAEQAARPGYWGEHLCSPVRFSKGVEELLKKSPLVFIEIGPGRILSNIIQQYTQGNRHANKNDKDKNKKSAPMIVNLVRHQQEKVPDDYFLLFKIGQLWLYNVKIDWGKFHNGEQRYRVSLPAYPFEGKRYRLNEDISRNMIERLPPMEIETPKFAGEAEPDLTTGVLPDDHEENYQAPRNELEQNIARVWQGLLGFEKIGIYDNFFYLNGDSLTATQLINHIKEMYPVEVALKDFFKEPTIAYLAKVIKKLLVEKVKNLPQEKKKRLAGQLTVDRKHII
jgi:acyl transferase domain-containing protein